MRLATIEAKKSTQQYELFIGRRGKDEFMKTIEEKVNARKPEHDISEVCDQFYNRPTRNGMAVSSLVQVFKRSIQTKGDELLR